MSRRRFVALLLVLLSVVAAAGAYFLVSSRGNTSGPIRIAVFLNLSGLEDAGYRPPIDWALENINAAGVAGRKVELVYFDEAQGDVEATAQRIANDTSIAAVIGPAFSRDVFLAAPIFIKAKKVMISPASTSGDVTRAFGDQKYVWRTTQSDIGQLRAMFLIAARDGLKDVSLLTGYDQYGSTFFDWFGFYATELRMNVGAVVRFGGDGAHCEPAVAKAIASHPTALFAVPYSTDATGCVARYMKANAPEVRVLYADIARIRTLFQTLGPAAEGLEGTSLAPDPRSRFEEVFRAKFRQPLPNYAANSYDALALLAYGLERSRSRTGEALAQALSEVTKAAGEPTGWDAQGISRALSLIRAGALPDVTGATGALHYDGDYTTDLASLTYGHWKATNGDFTFTEYLSTAREDNAGSESIAELFDTFASEALRLDQSSNGPAIDYQPPPRKGVWALIAATSFGWPNYRHQADALAQYQRLRANGVPDDRIILVASSDLARDPKNSDPGVIRNVPGGPNLWKDAQVDYQSKDITAADLLAILRGQKSTRLPNVIESDGGDDVYVFLVGHGGRQGLYTGVDAALDTVDDPDTVLDPSELAGAVTAMRQAAQYRRMLIAVEMCHAGTLGTQLDQPGVLLIGGANPFENSLADNYDVETKAWLGDQFAYRWSTLAGAAPDATLQEVYRDAYLGVQGSHVTVYNSANFGDLDQVKLREFLTP